MTALLHDGATAVAMAKELRTVLADHGIASDVHDGYGLALVSIWVGFVVWCDGERFWWRTGWNPRQYRPVYAWHPAMEPARAAHRIALHYADFRRRDAQAGGSVS
ncbi:hypothetical protein [Sinosporangium siamense]|uniref:Uncharacterized protein n=1 Tax=Sinosporangium siamense TaxID=1367973 RepID=A0A919RJC4_9ACTN|nr:hypothetical protein [Sinosporangium siamense]GII94703.1 hypothetical protein Ssi02_49340 [Sinosporangium siamense]